MTGEADLVRLWSAARHEDPRSSSPTGSTRPPGLHRDHTPSAPTPGTTSKQRSASASRTDAEGEPLLKQVRASPRPTDRAQPPLPRSPGSPRRRRSPPERRQQAGLIAGEPSRPRAGANAVPALSRTSPAPASRAVAPRPASNSRTTSALWAARRRRKADNGASARPTSPGGQRRARSAAARTHHRSDGPASVNSSKPVAPRERRPLPSARGEDAGHERRDTHVGDAHAAYVGCAGLVSDRAC